jgi:hypothetical protein
MILVHERAQCSVGTLEQRMLSGFHKLRHLFEECIDSIGFCFEQVSNLGYECPRFGGCIGYGYR